MSRGISGEEFLDDLRRVADEIGKSPSVEEYKEHGNHSFDLGRRKFGSWNEAKEEAGLETYDRYANDKKTLRVVCYKCDSGFRANPDHYKQACPKCGCQVVTDRAKIEFLSQSEAVQQLAEGPVVGRDKKISLDIRAIIDKLSVPGGIGSRIPTSMNDRNIYYLVGDERRAIDLFIDEYEDYIEEVLNQDGTNNVFAHQWNDYMYDLLIQQWHFR